MSCLFVPSLSAAARALCVDATLTAAEARAAEESRRGAAGAAGLRSDASPSAVGATLHLQGQSGSARDAAATHREEEAAAAEEEEAEDAAANHQSENEEAQEEEDGGEEVAEAEGEDEEVDSDDVDSEGSDGDAGAAGSGSASSQQRRARRAAAAAARETCRYTWAYRARLWMEAPTPHAATQLVARRWRITDASTGAAEEVSGAGVIGMYPTLTPLPSRPAWLQPGRDDATDSDLEPAAAASGAADVAGAATGSSAAGTAGAAVRAGAGEGGDVATASSTGGAGAGWSASAAALSAPAAAASSAASVAASAAAEYTVTLQQLGEGTAAGGLDIPFEYCSMTTLDTPAGRGSMEGAYAMAPLPAAPAGPVDARRPPSHLSGESLVGAEIVQWPLEVPAYIF
jgi:ribonuclease E